MKHRFAAAVTALTLLTLPAGAPLTAQAESFGALTYEVYTDHVEITGCDSAAISVTIPEEIDGLPVTGIGEGAFEGCKSLTSVTIPESVTGIGTWAFNRCESLTSVTVPESVTSIGQSAFMGCKSLSTIVIPESVTSIGTDAFYDTAWYDSQPDGLIYAGRVAYEYKGTCTGEIVLRPDTAGIADECFNTQGELSSVTIPEGVTSIGYGVFSGCTGLTSVTVPEGVTSIGKGAFKGCTSLSTIVIPESVTSIGTDAFSDTAWYDSQPDGLIYAGLVAYRYKGTCTGEIVLRPDTAGIADECFRGQRELSSVTIPEGVTSIGYGVFSGCKGLTSVTIPESVTSIGNYAFGNTGLTAVVIPKSVTLIADEAFSYCKQLQTVTVLNPDCIINANFQNSTFYYELTPFLEEPGVSGHFDGTFYGNEGSSIHRYARNNADRFISLEALAAAKTGDLNADGTQTVLDAVILQKHLVRSAPLCPFQTPLADVNGDHTINIIDLALLKRALTQNHA